MKDRQRFEDAYRAHSGAVVAYAARRADPATAADVVSETFLVAWRRVSDLPATDGQRAWLITIARNVLANSRRSERRRLRLVKRASSDLERTIRDLTTEQATVDRDLDVTIKAALDSLDTDDRELLTMLAWDGLTRTEIRQILGCSDEALRTRIHRARVRFNAALHQHQPTRSAPDSHDVHAKPASNPDDSTISTNSDQATSHNAALTMRGL